MTDFGRDEAREMPSFLFREALHIDGPSAVRAAAERQSCSICPRYWDVDATFRCARCGHPFAFTAAGQRVRYEEHRFGIDSLPRRCLACRRGWSRSAGGSSASPGAGER